MFSHILMLLPLLAIAGIIGVGLGSALAAFTQNRPSWRRHGLPYLGLALVMFGTIPVVLTITDLITRAPFKGECSGWMEKGSHPCTIWEYYFGETEFLFFFSAASAAPAFIIACITYVIVSRKRAAQVKHRAASGPPKGSA